MCSGHLTSLPCANFIYKFIFLKFPIEIFYEESRKECFFYYSMAALKLSTPHRVNWVVSHHTHYKFSFAVGSPHFFFFYFHPPLSGITILHLQLKQTQFIRNTHSLSYTQNLIFAALSQRPCPLMCVERVVLAIYGEACLRHGGICEILLRLARHDSLIVVYDRVHSITLSLTSPKWLDEHYLKPHRHVSYIISSVSDCYSRF